VTPVDDTAHREYIFYVEVNAHGGSTDLMGPYTLKIGCFSGSVTFSNNPSFDTVQKDMWVGDSTLSVYTM